MLLHLIPYANFVTVVSQVSHPERISVLDNRETKMLFPRAAEKMRCILVYYLECDRKFGLSGRLNMGLLLFCAGPVLTGAGVTNLAMV